MSAEIEPDTSEEIVKLRELQLAGALMAARQRPVDDSISWIMSQFGDTKHVVRGLINLAEYLLSEVADADDSTKEVVAQDAAVVALSRRLSLEAQV